MKLLLFSVVLFFVFSVSTAASTAKPVKKLNKFEQKIVEEVEKFKLQMKDGMPEANIPPMEPFNVPDRDLSPLSLGGMATLNVAKITNCIITGLSNFEMSHIKLNIMMMKVATNITFSHINVNGNYEIDGKALGIIPVFGHGPFRATVHKTLVSAQAVLGTTKDKKMQIESLNLHAEIEGLDANIEGLLGGGSLGEQINKMLQSVANKLARDLAPKMAGLVADFARKAINEALAKMNVGALIG